jgi:hypothetical protein
MSSVPHLPLDPEIASWVLIPVLVSMFLIAVLQDNLRVLLLSGGGGGGASTNLGRIRRDHLLRRAQRLRAACSVLPDESTWRSKRAYFTNTERGAFTAPLREAKADGMMLKFTMTMLESWGPGTGSTMLKQYALNFVPTILLGVFVNHFFSGFIVAKLPFSPPSAFRYILHSGLDLPELDTCYVSSLSWYILTLIGVRSLAGLLTEWLQNFEPVQLQSLPQQSPIMTQMLIGLPIPGSGGPSEEKVLEAERDNLHITVRNASLLGSVEERLVAL